MFEYTKDNHLKFDSGVSIGRCSRPIGTFKEECVEAAKDIASKTDQRIFVGYNHDIESQVMCLAFLEAKVKFTAVIPLLSNNLNLFNYVVAKDFLEGNGIPYKTVKVDVLEFFTKFSPSMAENNQILSYKNILHILAQRELSDRTYVLSDSTMTFVRPSTGNTKYVRIESSVFTAGKELAPPALQFSTTTPFNYYVENNLPVVPEFFAYTPELLSSFYLSEHTRAFVEVGDFVEMQMFDEVIKPMIFKMAWPNIKPIWTYSGIEEIDEIESIKHLSQHFREYFVKQQEESAAHIPYTELFDYLTNDGEVKSWNIEVEDFLSMFKKH